MGCACAGERDQSSPEAKQQKGSKQGIANEEPNSKAAPLVQEETPRFDLRVRPVDSIRALLTPLRNSYRVIRTLRHDKCSSLLLTEHQITHQRCLVREVQKKRKKPVGKGEVRLPLEGEIWSKLDHPNILKLFEIVQDDNCLYFISSAFQGGELQELLETSKSFYEQRVAEIMQQIFSILVYCHRLKIIHRNLRVENFVLQSPPKLDRIHVMLMGFDDACLTGKKKPLHPSDEVSQYIAPEVLTTRFTEKSDIWSCGIIMYNLILGQSPYGSSTGRELLLKIQRGAVSLSENLARKISPEGKRLVESLLVMEAEQRPTAAQCLESDWIRIYARRASAGQQIMVDSMTNLSAKHSIHAIKRAVMTFIISRVVRPAELEELTETFKMLDDNGDGQISKEELRKGLRRIMPDAEAKGEVERIMKETDENSNGKIDYTEFLILAYNEEKLLNEDNLKAAFKSMDRDSSGKISSEELKELLQVKNQPQKEDVWQEVMQEMDRSGDGEIDFQEFKLLMKKVYSL